MPWLHRISPLALKHLSTVGWVERPVRRSPKGEGGSDTHQFIRMSMGLAIRTKRPTRSLYPSDNCNDGRPSPLALRTPEGRAAVLDEALDDAAAAIAAAWIILLNPREIWE
jgi:hypothetical protein